MKIISRLLILFWISEDSKHKKKKKKMKKRKAMLAKKEKQQRKKDKLAAKTSKEWAATLRISEDQVAFIKKYWPVAAVAAVFFAAGSMFKARARRHAVVASRIIGR